MTNKSNALYIGTTNNFQKRIFEHKHPLINGFTKKYNNKLIYCEEFSTPEEAIRAEKIIKGWRRKKKIELVKSKNPTFRDLSQTS